MAARADTARGNAGAIRNTAMAESQYGRSAPALTPHTVIAGTRSSAIVAYSPISNTPMRAAATARLEMGRLARIALSFEK
ncbi:MAG: hypothetical protein BWY85_01664 [Firmicutes bacterium ADurb.Bin506]|nr:MAG: hypothetical protein BWY85_01664 [Firmicutes bacterium ADurb.Bin506]